MNIGIVGIEALIGRHPGTQRQVTFVVALQRLHFDRSQELLQRAPVRLDGLLVAFDSAPRQRAEIVIFQLLIKACDFLTELLQRKLQTTAPFAQRRLRFGEHPGHTFENRKVDFAGLAMQSAV